MDGGSPSVRQQQTALVDSSGGLGPPLLRRRRWWSATGIGELHGPALSSREQRTALVWFRRYKVTTAVAGACSTAVFDPPPSNDLLPGPRFSPRCSSSRAVEVASFCMGKQQRANFAPVEERKKAITVNNIQGIIPHDFPEGVYLRNGANPIFGGLKIAESIFGKKQSVVGGRKRPAFLPTAEGDLLAVLSANSPKFS
nr:carotenoid 9,10(9',10')-cleavage dioxygenase 1-like isoform X1 [Ipomoea batatas]